MLDIIIAVIVIKIIKTDPRVYAISEAWWGDMSGTHMCNE